MSPPAAREFWKALMDNASALVTDAHTLLAAGSYGRARSLGVLAQEELGKALWIYEDFSCSWSEGDETPRVVDKLEQHGRNHTKKYLEAVVFGDELAEFWGDYTRVRETAADLDSWEEVHEQRQREAEVAAREANNAKQHGFYVDLAEDGSVLSPTALLAGTTETDLQTAAQVIEMLLIRDHTRMKHDAKTTYDSTHEQQFRLLPVAHPENWAAFLDSRASDEHGPQEITVRAAEPSRKKPEAKPDQTIYPAPEP